MAKEQFTGVSKGPDNGLRAIFVGETFDGRETVNYLSYGDLDTRVAAEYAAGRFSIAAEFGRAKDALREKMKTPSGILDGGVVLPARLTRPAKAKKEPRVPWLG